MKSAGLRAQAMQAALAVAFILLLHPLDGSAQGTAFLYQGQLGVDGAPANGSYDMAFTLYATNMCGVAVAGPLTNSAVAVSNGLFTATLDFGVGVFNGGSLWLDISVSPAGSNSFVELTPRQPVLSVPYAITAYNASNVSGTVSAAQLEGTLSPGQLPAAVVTNGSSGVTLAGSFSGDGSGLANVNQTTFGTTSIGSTNLFYGLFCYFSSVNNSAPMGMDYIASSPYANTNWNLIGPNPVYIDPGFMLTNADGPTIQTGGGVTEANGVLYTVYCRYSGSGGEPSQLAIASSTDMTNWTMIATWSADDQFRNTFYDSPNWSQVNYGGTNWIIFDYCTNQPGPSGGVVQALPVSLSPTAAVFGSPVSITTNNIGIGIPGNVYTILTNNTGLFILPCCQYSADDGLYHARYSTNFFGLYTNLTDWSVHAPDGDFTPWLLSVSNNSAWYWWDNGNISVSSDYGTNWTMLSFQPLYWLNPAFQGSTGGWGIASKPEGIFWLSSPLEDQSVSMAQGSDVHFSGTVSANNLTAQTVHAANGIFNNLLVSGVVQGTAAQPFTVNNLDWGFSITNAGWFNFVGGQGISVGQDAYGGVFLGNGYSSDDVAVGAVFEFEDGNDPVDSPNGGLYGSQEGLFYVNAQQIEFAQGPVNSQAGYEANGTAGVTQNVDIQTNSDGPHGITLQFKNGLYIGDTPY